MSTADREAQREDYTSPGRVSPRQEGARQSDMTQTSSQQAPREGDQDFPRTNPSSSTTDRPTKEEDPTPRDQVLPMESDTMGKEATQDPSEPSPRGAGRSSPRASTSTGATGAATQEEASASRGGASGAAWDVIETVETQELPGPSEREGGLTSSVCFQVDEDALEPLPQLSRGPFTWLRMFDKPDCNRCLAILTEQLVPSFPFILPGLIALQVLSLGLPWWFTKIKGQEHITYGLFIYWNGTHYNYYTEYPSPILEATILESIATAWTVLLPIQLCCKPCSVRSNFFCVWLLVWSIFTSSGGYLAYLGYMGDPDMRVDACVILCGITSVIGLLSAFCNCVCMFRSRARMDIEVREDICETYNAPYPEDEAYHQPREKYRSYHHPHCSDYAIAHDMDHRPLTVTPRYPHYGSTDTTPRSDVATASTSRATVDRNTSQTMTSTSQTTSSTASTSRLDVRQNQSRMSTSSTRVAPPPGEVRRWRETRQAALCADLLEVVNPEVPLESATAESPEQARRERKQSVEAGSS